MTELKLGAYIENFWQFTKLPLGSEVLDMNGALHLQDGKEKHFVEFPALLTYLPPPTTTGPGIDEPTDAQVDAVLKAQPDWSNNRGYSYSSDQRFCRYIYILGFRAGREGYTP